MYRRLFIIAKEHSIGVPAGFNLFPIYPHRFLGFFFWKRIIRSVFEFRMAKFSSVSEQYWDGHLQHKNEVFVGRQAPFLFISYTDKWAWPAEDGKFTFPCYFLK